MKKLLEIDSIEELTEEEKADDYYMDQRDYAEVHDGDSLLTEIH